MPVIADELNFLLTGLTPNESLGGPPAAPIPTPALNNIFDNVSVAESAAGRVEYRCIILGNGNTTDTFYDAVIWLDETPSTGTTLEIGLEAVGTISSPIANETTAPGGITFSKPLTEGTALAIGDIPANGIVSIWLRRTVTAGAVAAPLDGSTIRIKGFPAPQ